MRATARRKPGPEFPSSVSPTNHPLVAEFSIQVPNGASICVEFGLDTTYGRQTGSRRAPRGGGGVRILVAGMLMNSLYHMRARVTLRDGTTELGRDHTFQTRAVPHDILPVVTVECARKDVNPGVELLNIVTPARVSVVCDLDGQVIWYYHNRLDDEWQGYAFPLRPLPNGNMLASVSNMYNDAPAQSVLREVDLAGDTVMGAHGAREIDLATLNQLLLDLKTPRGSTVQAAYFSHDALPLSNGHVILIVQQRKVVDIVLEPGRPAKKVPVDGDALVDLDESFRPVWVWSTFDHLDINRHPMHFPPDWTHCNAVLETPDGHLLLSSRHQSWILKIDYANGIGSGRILWKLGYGGSFNLAGGEAGDWFFGQHAPSIVATDNGRITRLAVFDDGNGRVMPARSDPGPPAGPLPPPGPPESYSRAVILDLDEEKRTAEVSWQYQPGFFTWWGGSIFLLPNGHVEFDMPQPFPDATSSRIMEVTSDQPNPKVVWRMDVSPGYVYRALRLPSLYPDVCW